MVRLTQAMTESACKAEGGVDTTGGDHGASPPWVLVQVVGHFEDPVVKHHPAVVLARMLPAKKKASWSGLGKPMMQKHKWVTCMTNNLLDFTEGNLFGGTAASGWTTRWVAHGRLCGRRSCSDSALVDVSACPWKNL